ncbi:hypothetical protein C0J52_13694 [Blattella germanica]|nr:hypothetical protein C0J52_13694 [Blattella germanica]
MAANLPDVNGWCGLASRGLIDPFRYEGTLTGDRYLGILNDSILPAIRQLYGNERLYYEQDSPPANYHRDVRAYLFRHFPNNWIGRRSPIEFPPRSPDLTPLDFYL